MTSTFSVVIPTLGRPSLATLLRSLAAQGEPAHEVVVVDDRPRPTTALDLAAYPAARVLPGYGLGPAHARNVGWRLTQSDWVVFIDDDVELSATWLLDLIADLTAAREDLSGVRIGGVQARVEVPLPRHRRPTDWERGTAGLERARWATAEMAYRRAALAQVSGFDERFSRAYREDSDLALRVMKAGWQLRRGQRSVTHPVRPSVPGASLRQQQGNADDALMLRLHGWGWRSRAGCPRGRLALHVLTTGAAGAALAGLAARRWNSAALALLAWSGLSGQFAWQRIAAGPRPPVEVREMALTSLAIPPAAVWHRAVGTWRTRRTPPWPAPVRAVLFDRDGTLIRDVAYNGDAAQVEPVPTAAASLARLRAAGLAVGVITNQSALARGLITREQLDAVNARVEELLGPFDTWQVCPHADQDGCDCRKPEPGMVYAAAAALGVQPYEVAVVGDIGSDIQAALAAGARAVLVPNLKTHPQEVAACDVTAQTLQEAVDVLLGAR